MSKYDYDVARELIKDERVTFESLIMACVARTLNDKTKYPIFRDCFRNIFHEYWDRVNGVNGFLRGEDRQADIIYADRDAANEKLVRDRNLAYRPKRSRRKVEPNDDVTAPIQRSGIEKRSTVQGI